MAYESCISREIVDAECRRPAHRPLQIKNRRHNNHLQYHAVRAPCKQPLLHHAYAQPIRRSIIVALALAAGCNGFIAPQHPATGKALRAAAIEEEPAAPKYPTVNVRRSVACNESTWSHVVDTPRRQRLSRATARRAGPPTSPNSWRASRARCRRWATSTPRASRRASPWPS